MSQFTRPAQLREWAARRGGLCKGDEDSSTSFPEDGKSPHSCPRVWSHSVGPQMWAHKLTQPREARKTGSRSLIHSTMSADSCTDTLSLRGPSSPVPAKKQKKDATKADVDALRKALFVYSEVNVKCCVPAVLEALFPSLSSGPVTAPFEGEQLQRPLLRGCLCSTAEQVLYSQSESCAGHSAAPQTASPRLAQPVVHLLSQALSSSSAVSRRT